MFSQGETRECRDGNADIVTGIKLDFKRSNESTRDFGHGSFHTERIHRTKYFATTRCDRSIPKMQYLYIRSTYRVKNHVIVELNIRFNSFVFGCVKLNISFPNDFSIFVYSFDNVLLFLYFKSRISRKTDNAEKNKYSKNGKIRQFE